MARILVTGYNGFAGSYVVSALAAAGYEVFGVSKHNSAAISGLIQHYQADLVDFVSLREVVAAVRPDSVVHLAAITFVPHANVTDIYMTNVIGTRNLLEALAEEGCITGAVMVVSSANIYGNRVFGALNESLSPNPLSDYAISKVACENLAAMYSNRIPYIVVRPFNYTGVGQPDHFIIPKIVGHIRAGATQIELGNLNVARDFSDVRFFADATTRLLATSEAIGETVNICSGRAYTLTEVLKITHHLTGHHFDVVTNPKFLRANEVMRLWGDPHKLTRLIGAIKGPPLEDTLRWMLDA